MAEAVFETDGDLMVPTVFARGPWTPDAQHGGAPAALLARAVERFDPPERVTLDSRARAALGSRERVALDPREHEALDAREREALDATGGTAREPRDAMTVVRVTVELLRPVPIEPLRVAVRLARPGKKVQLVEASLLIAANGTEVARATGLRLRRSQVPLPEGAVASGTPPLPAAGVVSQPPWASQIQYEGFHSGAVELRFVAGSFAEPGPATTWIRLRIPLVAGEPTSPLARVAAAADFGNGISWVLSRREGYRFINPDLTIYLHRHPVGEWVALDAATFPDPRGVGLAESRLYDEQGPIGRSVQSLLIERD
jgi:hypothetical protein